MKLNNSKSNVVAIGFDLVPSAGQNKYAIVGIDEKGKVVFKQEDATLARLIRLVWEYRPKIIACDNIFELSEDEGFLRKILSMLPDDIEVVQVTRLPDGSFVDLRSLANLAGIKVDGKMTPSKTAYVVALLALRGYGSRIIFTEEKTKIIVTKARHGSAGGMSQARFQRGVKASILRATRIIKKVLDKHGFDYDLVFRKSGHGLESAVFIVYAPRSALYGLIKTFHGKDLRIEIRPVYSGKIIFETRREHEVARRHLIVGIDPGIVTAVAAIDLRGNPIIVYSKKGLDRAEILEVIRRYGEPILIATDVTPPPDTVKKLASSLGLPLYTPPTPLSIDEKQELVQPLLKRIGRRLNPHERDALAAAVRALREYMSKFRQIESILSNYPAEISVENVKATVVKGKSVAEAIEEEIERILVEEHPKPVRSVRHPQQPQQPRCIEVSEHLREELEAAKARIKVLEAELKACKERLVHAENEARLAKLEAAEKAEEKYIELKRRVEVLHNELDKARKEIEKLKQELRNVLGLVKRVIIGELIPIPTVPTITYKNIEKIMQDPLFKRVKLILVKNPTYIDSKAAELLCSINPIAILVSDANGNNLEYQKLDCGVPIVYVAKDKVIEVDNVAFIDPLVYEEALTYKVEVLIARKPRENTDEHLPTVEMLKRLVEEYRRARKYMDQEDINEEYV